MSPLQDIPNDEQTSRIGSTPSRLNIQTNLKPTSSEDLKEFYSEDINYPLYRSDPLVQRMLAMGLITEADIVD